MPSGDTVTGLLRELDLGSSIAELDNLLEDTRVETSAFSDLFTDKVDLIPGTKGSGKSALFRIFADFLPDFLLQSRKVVIAHGVQKHGDNVFHAFKEQFDELSEDEFVGFWCIYLTSLAHEQFIKSDVFAKHLSGANSEIQEFRKACERANIPEIKAKKTLRDVLAWSLNVLKKWAPHLKYKLPEEAGTIELDLFGKALPAQQLETKNTIAEAPHFATDIKEKLESVLTKSNLSIWLMIDRLDEVFPRRSPLETRALRGLLRTMRVFISDRIRVKVFLRDDMLEQVVSGNEGFTALTHVTARKADTLRWSEETILAMLTKRLFATQAMRAIFNVELAPLKVSPSYQKQSFYKVFPPTVHSGEKQSSTLHWIYTHTSDAKGVVTPRDVLDLISKAKQYQLSECSQSITSSYDYLIGSKAIQYGLGELSRDKRDKYLKAEFPHLWPQIEKFEGGKTEYGIAQIQKILGSNWKAVVNDLMSIGVIGKHMRGSQVTYRFPYLYRKGLNLT